MPGMRFLFPAALWAGALPLAAQLHLDDGVTPPKLVSKVEPAYTEEARNAGIQGTVVFQVVVNQKGRIAEADMEVLCPLGYGLDETARAAVLQWRFHPGEKDGRPVDVHATIELHFRIVGLRYDAGAEKLRAAYNGSTLALERGDPVRHKWAVETLHELAEKKYAPAEWRLGRLYLDGSHIAADVPKGLELLRRAADRRHRHALHDLAAIYDEGKHVDADRPRALRLYRDAADAGSAQAQFFVAALHERGGELPQDSRRAIHYYRLCAASGTLICQYRLAKLLLVAGSGERDTVTALAWCGVAADRKHPEAQALLAEELPRLAPKLRTRVEQLKSALARAARPDGLR